MPHHAIAAFADFSRSVDFTRPIDARRQAEMRTDRFRNVERLKSSIVALNARLVATLTTGN
jgi:hypothetical protein